MQETYTKEEVFNLLQDCWDNAQYNLALQIRNREFSTFDTWVKETLI